MFTYSIAIHWNIYVVDEDPHMLAQWSTALGEELDEKKYVCDLHFNSSDICKFEKVLLHDGTYFYSHRERCNLKTNAVPSLNPYIQSLPVDWGIVKKVRYEKCRKPFGNRYIQHMFFFFQFRHLMISL